MKFWVSVRPYPAGAGSSVHDELVTIEGHCIRCALDGFYQRGEYDFKEWRVIEILRPIEAKVVEPQPLALDETGKPLTIGYTKTISREELEELYPSH